MSSEHNLGNGMGCLNSSMLVALQANQQLCRASVLAWSNSLRGWSNSPWAWSNLQMSVELVMQLDNGEVEVFNVGHGARVAVGISMSLKKRTIAAEEELHCTKLWALPWLQGGCIPCALPTPHHTTPLHHQATSSASTPACHHRACRPFRSALCLRMPLPSSTTPHAAPTATSCTPTLVFGGAPEWRGQLQGLLAASHTTLAHLHCYTVTRHCTVAHRCAAPLHRCAVPLRLLQRAGVPCAAQQRARPLQGRPQVPSRGGH